MNLIGVYLEDCVAIEGIMALYYTYAVEIASTIVIVAIIRHSLKTISSEGRREITSFGWGIILFLVFFVWGNLIGSFSSNWNLAQAGLIGMPVLIGFLSYLIVKFKAFNIKVLSTQILVFALIFLIFSTLFIRSIGNIRIIIVFTLLAISLLGYQLIRSVKREILQRERLEQLKLKLQESNTQLEGANEKLKGLDRLKTEFLSLASHQLRSPLTAIKGYASMLVEGDFGKISSKAKEATERIFESSKNLAIVVEDLLNVSKIEQGGMKYEMIDFDLGQVAEEMVKDLSITAEKKNLKLSYESDGKNHKIHGDKEKIRQVVLNFIDNGIKYTKEGKILVSVVNDSSKIRFSVSDTGMGMTEEIKESLFQKFSRGDGARMNTTGSGLGLYLAKEIVTAHQGSLGVNSPGMRKGSTFYMELSEVK
jgi:signal transduction histidine kinase